MGVAFVAVGFVIAFLGYAAGLAITPNGAIQQAVQQLMLLHGTIGLGIAGVGFLLLRLPAPQAALEDPSLLRQAWRLPSPPDIPGRAAANRAQAETYKVGARVRHASLGEGTVEEVGVNGILVVRFGEGTWEVGAAVLSPVAADRI